MRCCRLILGLWVLSLLCVTQSRAQTSEASAFSVASKAFQDRFYERSDKELGEFLVRYANSTHAPEAQLLQAQARHQLRLFDAAFDLLNRGLPKAGSWADQYLLWMGEIQMARGDYEGAAANYGRLCRDYPLSPLRLGASYGQALAQYRKNDLPAAMDLLRNSQGEFQRISQGLTNDTVAMGYLLLGRIAVTQNDPQQAQKGLQPLSTWKLSANLDWERYDLLARAELAAGQASSALPFTTNALSAAESSQSPTMKADTLALRGEIFRRLGRLNEALATYDSVAQSTNMPAKQQRQAALQGAELLLSQGKSAEAVARIEGFLATRPQEEGADLLHLKSGELQLDAWRIGSDKTQLALLTKARAHFDAILQQMTNSTLIGKAFLGKGWTYWEDSGLPLVSRMSEAQKAFQSAAERLIRSEDQALARYKVADTLFQQAQFASAVTNYQQVINQFGDLPGARSNLLAQAGHQIVRSLIVLGDIDEARVTMEDLVKNHPKSLQSDEAWLAVAQQMLETEAFAEGRQLLDKFIINRPESPLRTLAELSRARSLAFDNRWAEGAVELGKWALAHTNHPALGDAQFDRAWMTFRGGDETNSFQMFTNFLGKYPMHSLAPMAQNWVADFYYNREQWGAAEQNYQRVFQTTNEIANGLGYQARLMAARTAILRQGYSDARGYLTNLLGDANCPTNLAPEAWFMLGDVIIEQRIVNSTNSLNNYIEALNAFAMITKQYAGHRLEPIAYGKSGDCYFQLASQFPEYYSKATNAYVKVLEFSTAPVAARNQAEFGLALVLEKLSETSTATLRTALLKASLDRLLNIVYAKDSEGHASDPYWMKRAGLAAGRISELLNNKAATTALYQRLSDDLPSLRATWESKIRSVEASGKN